MRGTIGIALLCLAAIAPSGASADARTVVVREGDALITIAHREGVSVEELKTWNRLGGDMIRIGQKLVIRTSSSADDDIDWTPPFDYGAQGKPAPRAAGEPQRIAARDPASAVAARPYDKAPKKKKPLGRTYRVQKGDTLIGIALRHGTSVPEILAANPGLEPDRIFPGQTIDVGEPRPEVKFRLERGDTLVAVAGRYGVSRRDLVRWNPKLLQYDARPGSSLRIYTRAPVSASEAVGPTNRGRLEHGVKLPSHRGYFIRAPERAYGTEETIRWIVSAFNSVDARFKQNKIVRVHDLSDRNGGRLRDHKSHQNGRDADITYYQKNCGSNGCKFARFRPGELDVARQWTLLEYWLRNGQAEMIFIDYKLQAKLYRYARKKGVTKAQLESWIQYPRGKYEPDGVIRHYPEHDDHLHVRFVCPYSDLKCRP